MALRPHQLAERLGISVMPVREALRILAADDLVTISPRRGARVRGMSADDVEESFAIRGALEALAARLAVANLTDADIGRLRAMVQELRVAEESDDLTTFLEHDRAFHVLLYEASMRSQLAKRIMDLWDSLRRVYRLPESIEGTHMGLALASHEAILQACESGDASAVERAVRQHTEDAALRIVPALRKAASAGRP
jgi:DNA-binding GntR family transcriptional regulator